MQTFRYRVRLFSIRFGVHESHSAFAEKLWGKILSPDAHCKIHYYSVLKRWSTMPTHFHSQPSGCLIVTFALYVYLILKASVAIIFAVMSLILFDVKSIDFHTSSYRFCKCLFWVL